MLSQCSCALGFHCINTSFVILIQVPGVCALVVLEKFQYNLLHQVLGRIKIFCFLTIIRVLMSQIGSFGMVTSVSRDRYCRGRVCAFLVKQLRFIIMISRIVFVSELLCKAIRYHDKFLCYFSTKLRITNMIDLFRQQLAASHLFLICYLSIMKNHFRIFMFGFCSQLEILLYSSMLPKMICW